MNDAMKGKGSKPERRNARTTKTKTTRERFARSGYLPLPSTDPEVAEQWHPTKNGALQPDEFTRGSGQSVWWKCPAGSDHVWKARICRRTHANAATLGCPFCSSKRVSATNSLAAVCPEIAEEWDFRKNNAKLTPTTVVSGSCKKVWWRCSAQPDHQWQEVIAYRTQKGFGCPFCSNRRHTVSNSLAVVRPDLAAQWHPKKNKKLTPDAIVATTKRQVWWKCDRAPDHEWKASCLRRVHGSGCPSCLGRKVSTTNSLRTVNSEVAKQWHPKKNGSLRPEDVTAFCKKFVWWRCQQKHEWRQLVNSRARSKVNCPYCLRESNSIETGSKALLKQWHPTKNKGLKPSRVTMGARTMIWWQCPMSAEHVWKESARRRSAGSGCPFCAGRRLCKANSLKTKCPAVARQWYFELNFPLTPDQVVAGSRVEVWWRCRKHADHIWKQRVMVRTKVGAKGTCPFCSWRRVAVSNCLATLFPDIATEWHRSKNGGLSPTQVMPNSKQQVWWRCSIDERHAWEAVIADRTRKGGSGCPHCYAMVSKRNCLKSEFPAIARELHKTKNGKISALEIATDSLESLWWRCRNKHEWQQTVRSRTEQDADCPECVGRFN